MPSNVLKFRTPLQECGTHITLPSHLMLPHRVFGCTVFVHLQRNQRTKLNSCVIHFVFLGYGKSQKGYCWFDPIAKRTYTTIDATFHESDIFYPFHVLLQFRWRVILNR